mgnify:CR=1 FL=1
MKNKKIKNIFCWLTQKSGEKKKRKERKEKTFMAQMPLKNKKKSGRRQNEGEKKNRTNRKF